MKRKRKATPTPTPPSSSVEDVLVSGADGVQDASSIDAAGDIHDGCSIVQVTDLDLAICLISIGVPLREDPPYTHVELKNGKSRWVFNFQTETLDGGMSTQDAIDAFRRDMEWVDKNPENLLTGAMCALKNRARLIDHMKRSKPWVAYKARGNSGGVIMVIKGSRKDKLCQEARMERCDPFEDKKLEAQKQARRIQAESKKLEAMERHRRNQP